MERLRLATVTETFPPEVNGVARNMGIVVEGLLRRGHEIQLVRPRQRGETSPVELPGVEQVVVGGFPIPGYPQLRMGLPSRGLLERAWRERRPDLVHIATEGPLGWSALGAALALEIPVASDFHTNFHAY